MWRVVLATLFLIAVAFSAASARNQKASSTGVQPVSPVAVAGWATKDDALDLLVIVRGNPGWWTSSYGSNSTSHSEDGFSIRAQYGGRDLYVRFDAIKRIAAVQGIKVEVGANNIVLVDDVDSPSGVKIFGLEKVAPQMESPGIATVIRRSANAVRFLRCDVRLAEEKFEVIASRLCGAIREGK